MKKMAFVAAGLITFLSFPFLAMGNPSVIINGYNVTGITDQKFENVQVQFDSSGNIIITAPQYKLVTVNNGGNVTNSPSPGNPSSGTASSGNPSSGSASAKSVNPLVPAVGGPVVYDRNALPDGVNPTYLVAEFSEAGLLGYHVDVYINGKYIKEMKQDNAQQTMDVSRFLVKGKNTIQYRLVRAANAGGTASAYVELWFAKLEGRQGSSLNLSGQYGEIKIMGKDGDKSYTIELTVP